MIELERNPHMVFSYCDTDHGYIHSAELSTVPTSPYIYAHLPSTT